MPKRWLIVKRQLAPTPMTSFREEMRKTYAKEDLHHPFAVIVHYLSEDECKT
jgi:hypothetical protein